MIEGFIKGAIKFTVLLLKNQTNRLNRSFKNTEILYRNAVTWGNSAFGLTLLMAMSFCLFPSFLEIRLLSDI